MRRQGIEERLAAWVTLLQAHAVMVDVLERNLEHRAGLPLSSYEVLLRLDMAPAGRLRMLDLSRSLLLSKSGVTRLVDRMEEAGLVRRSTSPEDRRVTLVAVTDTGRRRFRAATPVHLRGIEEHFGRPLGEDVHALRMALRKVLAANGHPDEACHGPTDFEGVCGTKRRPAPRPARRP
jgi:DNA-binding MarR family transcriptional regulator